MKKPLVHTVPRREYLVTLPLSKKTYRRIKTHRRIKTLFQKVIPAAKINLTFKTEHRIAHFMKFKGVIPINLRLHIIYHFKCPSCNAGYIGGKPVRILRSEDVNI